MLECLHQLHQRKTTGIVMAEISLRPSKGHLPQSLTQRAQRKLAKERRGSWHQIMYQWWWTFRFDNTKGEVYMRIFLRRVETSYLAAFLMITCWPVATPFQAQTIADRINWPAYQDMAVDLMRQYLRINTSNPP